MRKLLLIFIVIIGLFVFKDNVYADWIAGYEPGNLEFNIYNDETNQFEKQKITTMYLAYENGILEPYPGTIEAGDEVYVIDDKIILSVPKKDGYYFSGWYLDENYEKSFLTSNIDKPFKDLNLKLYGKWVKDKPNNKTYIFGKNVYIVDLMWGCSNWLDGCSRYGEYIYIPSNKYITNETDNLYDLPLLKSENDTFLGWYDSYNWTYYRDLKFSDKKIDSIEDLVSFNENGSIILYANWKSYEYTEKDMENREKMTNDIHSANYSKINIKYYILNDETGSFEENDIGGAYISRSNALGKSAMIPLGMEDKNVIVVDGKYVIAIPEKDGYYFDGWYLDKEFKKEFKDKALGKQLSLADSNFSLYGKWTKDAPTQNKKTYKMGEDLFIVELLLNRSSDNLNLYGSYIYIKGNDYLINEMGKIKKLPSRFSDRIDDSRKCIYKFYGWTSGDLKIDNNFKNIDEVEGYKGYIPMSILWLTDYDDFETKRAEIKKKNSTNVDKTTTTTSNSKNKNTNTDDHRKHFPIPIFMCGVLVLYVFSSVVYIKQRKEKKKNL